MENTRIEEVEVRLEQELEVPFKAALTKLGFSGSAGLRLRVELQQADGRKKRSNARAATWDSESEPMKVWLEQPQTKAAERSEIAPPIELPSPSPVAKAEVSQSISNAGLSASAEVELVRALDHAESTPGWTFVSLKKFRDEILPLENTSSIRSDVERQNALRLAIDKKIILKKPIPNPKSPQFPVTSIRLNRLMPEVQKILGQSTKDLDFHPIHIKGEPLSATILRERR